MTARQEAFVQEYLVCLNGAAAARKAGYLTKNSDTFAAELLGKTHIRAAIQAAMDERAKRTQISADYVLKNIVEIGERCMEKVPVMRGSGTERKQAITLTKDPDTGEEVLANVWSFDAQGALKAQELLGKHLKMFTDKLEHSGTVNIIASPEDERL
jgi:phage terminase small subunit